MSAAATSQRPGPGEEPRPPSGTAGATPHRQRWARVDLAVVLAALTLLSTAWRLWLVRDSRWLTVRVDEDGYLLLARVLAGGPGGVTSENPLFRHLGYPLLITPVYWFTQDPQTVYQGVQVVNAVVNSLTLPLLYLVARRVVGLSRPLSILTAVTAASMPAVVFYGEFALTDAVLAPLFMAWILAVHGAVTNQRRAVSWALLAGMVAGALWLVHVRSVVIIAVHVLVLGYLGLRRQVRPDAVAASWLGILVSIPIDLWTRAAVGDAVVMAGNSPSGTLLQRLSNPFGIVHTVNWAIGQVWYLTISTLGLAALGGVAAVTWLRRREAGDVSRTVFAACLGMVTLGIAFFSAATLPDDERINLYTYARYLAFTAPLWIVLAVAALTLLAPQERPAGRLARAGRLAAVAAAVLLGCTHIVISYSRRLRGDAFLAFDAPEASALTGSWDRMRLAAVTAVALVALLGLALLLTLPRTRPVGLAVMLVASLAAMPAITGNAARPMSRDFEPAVSLTREVGVTPADTVVVDKGLTWWALANIQWEVAWSPVARFDSTSAAPPAEATVVITPWRSPTHRWTWNGAAQGWRVVHLDEKSGTAVWRRR